MAVLVALALLVGGEGKAGAQDDFSLGTISGRVVDAATLQPLPGSVVQLDQNGGVGTRHPGAAVSSDGAGEYRFTGIPPGSYQLRITRLGYVPATIQVELQVASAPTRISAGLEVEPVRLSAVDVRARRPPPFLRSPIPSDSGAPGGLMLATLRQPEHVVLDIRSLTQSELVESVTLAETDLFRALQRTPGVTTRDDFTATLWTRGASWDQTRVYLDGMPLYNPTHAGWLFSAVNPDALGEAVFYPGARPPRFGEGAAAVLDLRARSGSGGSEGVRGRGELSLASARLALDGGTAGGELNWMVAARRTYVDLLTGLAGAATSNEGLYIPYDFADVVARVDGMVEGVDYSATGIVERDRLRGGIPGILQANRGRWGNRSGRVSVGVPLGPLRLEVGIGETRFRASVLRDERARLQGDEPTLPPLESLIRHRSWRVQLSPASDPGDAPNWAIGLEAVRDSVGYEGPFSLLGELAVVLPRDSAPTSNLTLGSSLRYRAFWAQNRLALGPVSLETGVRIESGDSVLNGGTLRVAPRLAGSLDLDRRTRISAGWSRMWQYTQDIAPVAGPLGPQLHLTHLWVLAQTAGYSAIRSDVVTGGVERSIAPGWLIGVNAYQRWARGIEVPNPDSGRIVPDRDPSVQAANQAHGVEVLVRKVGERWSGSLGYTLGFSDMRAEVLEPDTAVFEFPSSADVRHALDAMLFVRMGEGVRLGGAFTYGSGVPYTRLILPAQEADDPAVRLGEANALRTPSYASLDLVAELSRTVGTWDLTGYLQLRNALGRNNAVTYAGSSICRPVMSGGGCVGGIRDRFEAGIPRLPLIGVRFTF